MWQSMHAEHQIYNKWYEDGDLSELNDHIGDQITQHIQMVDAVIIWSGDVCFKYCTQCLEAILRSRQDHEINPARLQTDV
jgi:hypothetical protein